MKQKVTIEIISFLLILLFVYAAFSKLLEYDSFKIQLVNSPFLKPVSGIIVWLVPAIELIIAVMLTVTYTRKKGLYVSFILLLIFTLYIAGMLLSGINLPCSCGGILQQLTWKQHLLFNLFFIILAFVGIVMERKEKLKYAVWNSLKILFQKGTPTLKINVRHFRYTCLHNCSYYRCICHRKMSRKEMNTTVLWQRKYYAHNGKEAENPSKE